MALNPFALILTKERGVASPWPIHISLVFSCLPVQRVGSCYGRTRGRPEFVILANRSGAMAPLQGQHGQIPACCALFVNREPEQRLEAGLEDLFAMERPVKRQHAEQ
jgi:hypothetical protein